MESKMSLLSLMTSSVWNRTYRGLEALVPVAGFTEGDDLVLPASVLSACNFPGEGFAGCDFPNCFFLTYVVSVCLIGWVLVFLVLLTFVDIVLAVSVFVLAVSVFALVRLALVVLGFAASGLELSGRVKACLTRRETDTVRPMAPITLCLTSSVLLHARSPPTSLETRPPFPRPIALSFPLGLFVLSSKSSFFCRTCMARFFLSLTTLLAMGAEERAMLDWLVREVRVADLRRPKLLSATNVQLRRMKLYGEGVAAGAGVVVPRGRRSVTPSPPSLAPGATGPFLPFFMVATR